MAKIIGGLAASHTPTIGFAYDRNKSNDPAWRPIFENFKPLSDWIVKQRPRVFFLGDVVPIAWGHDPQPAWRVESAFALMSVELMAIGVFGLTIIFLIGNALFGDKADTAR